MSAVLEQGNAKNTDKMMNMFHGKVQDQLDFYEKLRNKKGCDLPFHLKEEAQKDR